MIAGASATTITSWTDTARPAMPEQPLSRDALAATRRSAKSTKFPITDAVRLGDGYRYCGSRRLISNSVRYNDLVRRHSGNSKRAVVVSTAEHANCFGT